MKTEASRPQSIFTILRSAALASALLGFTGCVPVSVDGNAAPGSSGAKMSPEEQRKQIAAVDGTTQNLDLQINEVTSWSSNPRAAYDAVYVVAVGGEGIPVKGTITSISNSGGMTTLACSVAPQNSEMSIGNDYYGAASMTLKINPSRRKFAVVFPSPAGMLWKSGQQVQFMFGQSGEVIQIQDGGWDRYRIETIAGRISLSHRGTTVTDVVGMSDDRKRYQSDGVHKGFDYIVLRGSKWYVFSYAKGPGGSGVSWVLKKVKPR